MFERPRRSRVFLAAVLFPFIVLFAGRASADRVNFAKDQEASSSTTSGDDGPEFAFDGIVSNFHFLRTTHATNAQRFQATYPRAITTTHFSSIGSGPPPQTIF